MLPARAFTIPALQVVPMSMLRRVLPGGFLLAAACGGGNGGTDPEPDQVVSVQVQSPATTVAIGGSLQLVAYPKDAGGGIVVGKTATWATLNASIATVSGSGLVSGVAIGQTAITATIGGVTGSLNITVSGVPNLAITSVWLTQGTQRPDGSLPLVIGGLPALLNVIGTVEPAFPGKGPPVRVRVYEGANLRYEESGFAAGQLAATPDNGAPLYQVLIPSQWIRPDMRVEVVANPGGTVPEDRLNDNSWPATGVAGVIPTRSVAPMEIRVVPILLTVGNSLGIVTQASLQEYLYGVRQMFPVAELTGTIAPTFSTDVNFGSGTPAAWTQILPQLDALRVIEGTTRYYVGAIRPPSGVTFVQNGGWGYIPNNPLGSGPGTRTSLVVGVSWFSRQAMTLELVAHELGHNHGRQHAPCGNPSGPDPLYPYAGATLGVWTHDVYSYFSGLAPTIRSIGPSAGFDLMSYCVPVWTSDYTYEALLNVRSAILTAPPPVPCECVMVWGTVSPGGLTVGPVFETAAHVARSAGGDVRVEGLDAAGRVLFSEPVATAAIDHAPGVRQFLLAIPREVAGGSALVDIRVVDAGGRAVMAPRGDVVAPQVVGRRTGPEVVEMTWDAGRTPGVLVRDPATGTVLGIGTSGRLVLRSTAPEVEVSSAQGAASRRARVVIR